MKKILIATFSLGLICSLGTLVSASVITEVEPNDPLYAAMDIDPYFSTEANGDILDSTTVPWVSIEGSGDNLSPTGWYCDTYDYFSFTADAGATGWFDIDYGYTYTGGNMDAEIALWDSAGNLLAYNDNADTSLGAGGSTSGLDSFLEYNFLSTGTYYIGVAEFNSYADAGGWSNYSNGLDGSGRDTYTLQVSIANPAPVPEPATMLLFGTGLTGLAALGRRRKKS